MKSEVRIFIVLLSFVLFACSYKSDKPSVSQPKKNALKEQSENGASLKELEERLDTLKVIQELIEGKYTNSKIINLVHGDLNMDGKKDVLVVASRSCEPNESVSDDSECYRLIIYLADGKNNFKFKLDNETVLECSDCQRGMPILQIKSGAISIRSTYGMCKKDIITAVYTFNKQDESWRLTTIDKVLLDCEQDPSTGEPKTRHFPTETVADFGLVKL